jgi:dihydrolipoamide dehydrogenase
MAVGRRPVTEDLGLEENGVELANGFIRIDEWCRTTAEGVYAIGDVAGEPMLAHVGSHEGMVAAEHIAGEAHHPMKYDNIPSVGYCHPEIASIGMTEARAREAGHEVKIGKYPLMSHGRALTAGANAEAGLGRELETTLDEIAAHPHAHPSMAEALMQAAFVALGRPIDV